MRMSEWVGGAVKCGQVALSEEEEVSASNSAFDSYSTPILSCFAAVVLNLNNQRTDYLLACMPRLLGVGCPALLVALQYSIAVVILCICKFCILRLHTNIASLHFSINSLVHSSIPPTANRPPHMSQNTNLYSGVRQQ